MAIEQIDDRRFKYQVAFANGNGQVFPVNAGSVQLLEIEDNLFTMFASGRMVIEGSFNGIEGAQDADPLARYQVRGDARDFLVVNITPEVSEGNFLEQQDFSVLKLNYLFAITKVDDIPGDSNTKLKLIHFRELPHQMLIEKYARLFSGDYAEEAGLSNSSRSAPTGILLRELIKQVVGVDDDAFGIWDNGAKSIFFRSVAGAKAIDDFNYIYRNHTSEEANDFCVFTYGRDGLFSLISLAKYFQLQFEDPATYVTETLLFGGSNNSQGEGRREVSYPSGPFLPGFSNIEEYYIANTYGEDYSDVIKSAVTSTINGSLNVHKLNFEDGYIQRANDDFFKLYIEPFTNLHGSAVNSAIPLNKSVLENNTYEQVPSSLPLNYSLASGRNRVLLNMLFLGNVMKVKLRGYTYRQSGRFVDIKRASDTTEPNFDRKYIGRWFVTNVRHVFTPTTYENALECVKPYYVDVVNNSEVS